MKYIFYVIMTCLIFSSNLSGANEKPREALIKKYTAELNRLSERQTAILILTYFEGRDIDLGLVLTSIVWKESMFGTYVVNKSDGKYGSYGLAQILLETSARRHNVKTPKDRDKLRRKLITDDTFSLNEAKNELLYWKQVYTEGPKAVKYWITHTVGSYNAGWKGQEKRGKRYAKDTKIRRRALIQFFKDKKNLEKYPVLKEYLLEIRKDLVKQKLLKS